MTDTLAEIDEPTLLSRLQALKAQEPNLRARDAAEKLGVSEAEFVAARCGDGVQRLQNSWGDLIKEFPLLGTVMSLTRNEHVVHEKVGAFNKVSIMQNMGLVLDEDIDLRIFLGHWHSGFSVTEETRSGTRHSFQFFDLDGTAVYKLYLREESDHEAYESLAEKYRHADQSNIQLVSAKISPPADRPDQDIDRDVLRDRWIALQDVHDFYAMLQELGVGRVQALRLVGEEFAYKVETNSFRIGLEMTAESGLPIMIFAGSAGMIQIHTGPVHKLKEMGPWFNVLDPGFNLHLRQDHIATAWVVKKPTRDGIVTALEIYNADDQQIAWMFGKRKPGEVEDTAWKAVAHALPILEGTAQ